MKAFMISIVLMMLAASVPTTDARSCKNPKQAVLALLNCVATNNATCAANNNKIASDHNSYVSRSNLQGYSIKMKAFMISIVLMMLAASVPTTDARSCKNPKQAVLSLLDCVATNNATCAANSYLPSFQRFHNENLTAPVAVTDPSFWSGVFFVFPRFEFEIKFAATVGINRADVRYIEKITSTDGSNAGVPGAPFNTYPFSQTILQHEHVLVSMDKNCKIFKWEQYGDNAEQVAPDIVLGDLIAALTPPQ